MRNLLPYIYDYISVMLEDDEIKKLARRIVLFGSVASGEHDKDSDIDIFLEVSPGFSAKVDDLVKKSKKRFAVSERKWRLLGIKNPIKIIVGNLEEARWKELKSEIISAGITLYGKFESLPENIKHYSLFTYSLSGLSQKGKMKLIRTFFGYTTKKGKKKYKQAGILKEIGGEKLGANSLLVPLERSREIQRIFNKLKVTPEICEVWIKS